MGLKIIPNIKPVARVHYVNAINLKEATPKPEHLIVGFTIGQAAVIK